MAARIAARSAEAASSLLSPEAVKGLTGFCAIGAPGGREGCALRAKVRVDCGFEKPTRGEGGNQAGALEDGAEGRFHQKQGMTNSGNWQDLSGRGRWKAGQAGGVARIVD